MLLLLLEFVLPLPVEASLNTASSVIKLSPPLSWTRKRFISDKNNYADVLFDARMVKLFSFSFHLSGWCCVDVVEESLKIVTWEGTVHLLVGPCNSFWTVASFSEILIISVRWFLWCLWWWWWRNCFYWRVKMEAAVIMVVVELVLTITWTTKSMMIWRW